MSDSIRAIIVDDDPHAREYIHHLLISFFPEITVEAKYESVHEAVVSIKQDIPRILFLDIQLQDGLGFDILEYSKNKRMATIFVTGYAHYALPAIQSGAVGYILKPVDKPLFFKAVQRAKEKLSRMEVNDPETDTIAIRQIDSMEIVQLSRVMYLKSEGNYTTFHFEDGEKLITSKTLKEYDDILAKKGFFRTHRSFLVNLKFIKTYRFTDGMLVLTDGTLVEVAKAKHAKLTHMFT